MVTVWARLRAFLHGRWRRHCLRYTYFKNSAGRIEMLVTLECVDCDKRFLSRPIPPPGS